MKFNHDLRLKRINFEITKTERKLAELKKDTEFYATQLKNQNIAKATLLTSPTKQNEIQIQ